MQLLGGGGGSPETEIRIDDAYFGNGGDDLTVEFSWSGMSTAVDVEYAVQASVTSGPDQGSSLGFEEGSGLGPGQDSITLDASGIAPGSDVLATAQLIAPESDTDDESVTKPFTDPGLQFGEITADESEVTVEWGATNIPTGTEAEFYIALAEVGGIEIDGETATDSGSIFTGTAVLTHGVSAGESKDYEVRMTLISPSLTGTPDQNEENGQIQERITVEVADGGGGTDPGDGSDPPDDEDPPEDDDPDPEPDPEPDPDPSPSDLDVDVSCNVEEGEFDPGEKFNVEVVVDNRESRILQFDLTIRVDGEVVQGPLDLQIAADSVNRFQRYPEAPEVSSGTRDVPVSIEYNVEEFDG